MDETTMGKRADTRGRIVRAASGLLAEGGREAVTRRAVAEAAGVQAPTIYRQFGDMGGLLDEVGTRGFAAYLNDTEPGPGGDSVEDLRAGWQRHVGFDDDPVRDLRRGWDLQLGFGLANPAFYKLVYADPRPGHTHVAALEAAEVLRRLVRRVAEAGRLRVGEERAARLLQAAGSGVALALIGVEPEERDRGLSDMAREAVIAVITTDAPAPAAPGPPGAAIHLSALLPQTPALTDRERALLQEWLDRIAEG